jgi:hypothetical protein
VATLYITQEYTHHSARCTGNVEDSAIDSGLKYLGAQMTSFTSTRPYYVLFGISRVGLASGYKYFGSTDWFKWGSDRLLQQEHPDGSWGVTTSPEFYNGIPDTALALLFLTRGSAPIMMNKLQYDAGGAANAKTTAAANTWNQRPRDVANLSRFVGKEIESTLSWQIVTLQNSPEDMLDAPILYMSGAAAPRFSPEDVAKLQRYVEDGGLILGHADCSSGPFADGFKKLGEQMFPGHRFRELESTSPVYTNESFDRNAWRSKPLIESLSNGDRELMVLIPTGDPAREWQTQSFMQVKRDVYAQFMIDLFLYAVDKQGLRHRGETFLVPCRDDVPASKPIKIGRIQYAGNWNPEPGGWRRLTNVMHNHSVAELNVHPVDPSTPGQLNATFALLSLTIASPDAKLSDTARAAIRDYVKNGGTLLVDVAGGCSAYRAAAEAELAKLWPEASKELPVLAVDSPVLSALHTNTAMSIQSVDYRRFQRSSGTLHEPQLRGLSIGNRTAVLYSPQDVSVGLVGEPVDGIEGYAPDDAAKIVAAVIAYASDQR